MFCFIIVEYFIMDFPNRVLRKMYLFIQDYSCSLLTGGIFIELGLFLEDRS